jgi:threonine/homoserine/homoserine lactone efflux protein
MSLFFAMGMFALTMSISPGPVNMITLSAGVNYGLRRTMPFVCGAAIGFTLLLATVGLGVSQLVERTPIFLNVLSFLGAILIAYMGYRIATAKPSHDTQVHEAPVFAQGFLLQWLNPKAWIASLTGVSAFGLADSRGMLIAFCTMYLVVCFASIATWAYIGSRLTETLENDSRLATFNTLMGAALILVAIFLFYLQLKGTGAVTTG